MLRLIYGSLICVGLRCQTDQTPLAVPFLGLPHLRWLFRPLLSHLSKGFHSLPDGEPTHSAGPFPVWFVTPLN